MINTTKIVFFCVLVVLCVHVRSRDCIQLDDMERTTVDDRVLDNGASVETTETTMTSHADDDRAIDVTSEQSVGETSTSSPVNSSAATRPAVDTTTVLVVGGVDGSGASVVDGLRSSVEERRRYVELNFDNPSSTTLRSPAVEPADLTTAGVSVQDVVSSADVELLIDRQSSGSTIAAESSPGFENPDSTGSQTDDERRLQTSSADQTTTLTSVDVFSVVVMTTSTTTTTRSVADDKQPIDDGGLTAFPVATSDGDVGSLTSATALSTSDGMITTTAELTREADDVITTEPNVDIVSTPLTSMSTTHDVTSGATIPTTTLQRLTGNRSTVGTTDRKLLSSSTVWTSTTVLPVDDLVPGASTTQSDAAVEHSTSSSGLETTSTEADDALWLPLGLPLAAAAGALAAAVVLVIVIIISVVIVAVRLSRRSRNRHSFVSDRSFNYRRNADIVIEPRQPRTSGRSKRPSDVLELDGIALTYKRGLAPPSARIDGDDNVFHGTFPSAGAAWTNSSVENIDNPHANGNKTNNLYGKDSDTDSVTEKGMSTFTARNAAYRGRHPPSDKN